MTEHEIKQKMWDDMTPEARNMVLNIDPNFTPDKLPTPVIDDLDENEHIVYLLNDIKRSIESLNEMIKSVQDEIRRIKRSVL